MEIIQQSFINGTGNGYNLLFGGRILDYLVTFMWYSEGRIQIQPLDLFVNGGITKNTKVEDLIKLTSTAHVPRNKDVKMIAFSKYD